MVTISDVSQKTEISIQKVLIVQTEAKTIPYVPPQIDCRAAGNLGTLLTAQPITADSVSTIKITHITKTIKDGISKTRIEKHIVIIRHADIDQD